MLERGDDGSWSEPPEPFGGAGATSLDFAYDGRPVAVRDEAGTLWLFYHTLRKERWAIWYKTYREQQGWTPSQPLTDRRIDDRHPTAALHGAMLWVFWEGYDSVARKWHITYRQLAENGWSPIADPTAQPRAGGDPDAERRQPRAVADNAGGLWLFWLEKSGTRWQLKYNRHDGTDWESASALGFPPDNGVDPGVEGDPFVLFHPGDAGQRLWVFWARKTATGAPGRTRWSIVYRVKAGLDVNTSEDWSGIRVLPRPQPDAQEREPAALIAADGNVELFWRSNRGGSHSVWHSIVDRESHVWGAAQTLTPDPYSQQGPCPVATANGTLLVYRSNESLSYTSQVYAATETLDARYAGSTTVDTRNTAKMALRGRFEDFQTYSYDAGAADGRTNLDWYARDTVGLYLTPSGDDQTLLERNQRLLEDVLGQFLPLPVRPVFIIEPGVSLESVDSESVDSDELPSPESRRSDSVNRIRD